MLFNQQPEFNLWDSHGGTEELSPTGCFLTFIMPMCEHMLSSERKTESEREKGRKEGEEGGGGRGEKNTQIRKIHEKIKNYKLL